MLKDRQGLIEDCRIAKEALCDTKAIDTELAELRGELEVVTELTRKAIKENASSVVDRAKWQKRNDAYLKRYDKAARRIDELESVRCERIAKSKVIEGFIRDIESRPLAIDGFDEKLWLAVIDTVTVARDGSMTFRFKNGAEITV